MDETPDIEPEAAAELADDELDNVEGGGIAAVLGAGGNGGSAGAAIGSFFGTD